MSKARKSVTVNDVLYGTKKNQIFMNPNPGMPNSLELAALNATGLIGMKTGFEAENKNRSDYNNAIHQLDPRFTNLRPLNSYIVRFQLRLEEKRSDLIVPASGDILLPSRSGKHKEAVKDPYRFKQVAIVVCVPEHETQLKPGMLVHCVGPNPIGNIDDGILGYDCEYLHPEYNQPVGPKDPKDKDFGYAIVDRGRIKVIIQDATPEVPSAEAQSESTD